MIAQAEQVEPRRGRPPGRIAAEALELLGRAVDLDRRIALELERLGIETPPIRHGRGAYGKGLDRQGRFEAAAALAGDRAETVRPLLREAAELRWRVVLLHDAHARKLAQVMLRGVTAYDDLLQTVRRGAYEAAKRFDPGSGVKFWTYANWWARARVTRELQPSNINALGIEQLRNVAKAEASGVHGDGAVAEAIGVSVGRLRTLRSAAQVWVSLDAPIGQDDERTLHETLSIDEDGDGDRMGAARIRLELDQLEPRTRQVLKLRYGLRDGERLGLREIGDELGLSRERVRQIEQQGLALLREAMRPACPVEESSLVTTSARPAGPELAHKRMPRLDEVVEIVRQHPEGVAVRQIARRIGVPSEYVSQVLAIARYRGLVTSSGVSQATRYFPAALGVDVAASVPATAAAPAEPRRSRMARLVLERPGMTTGELVAALDCHPNRVTQLGQALGLHREHDRIQSNGRTVYVNRWYPVASPTDAQPSPSDPPTVESSPHEEPGALPGGGVAQPASPAAAGGAGEGPSPGGGASPVGLPAPRELGTEGALPSPAADPVRPPPVPVEGAPAASSLGVVREEGGSGDSTTSQPGALAPCPEEVLDAGGDPVLRREAGADDSARGAGADRRPPGEGGPGGGDLGRDGGDPRWGGADVAGGDGPDGAPQRGAPERVEPPAAAGPGAEDGARPRQARAAGGRDSVGRRVDINPSLFQRVLTQTTRIRELERQVDGALERADDAESDLVAVRESLDRLQIPAGPLGWRLGWLEGRLGQAVGR